VFEEFSEYSLVYAVSYIESEADRTDLHLQVDWGDAGKVWLNGKEIWSHVGWLPGVDLVTGVELKAGLNVLVYKAVNEPTEWEGSVRFTDAAGQPVKGIKVGLEPTEAGQR